MGNHDTETAVIATPISFVAPSTSTNNTNTTNSDTSPSSNNEENVYKKDGSNTATFGWTLGSSNNTPFTFKTDTDNEPQTTPVTFGLTQNANSDNSAGGNASFSSSNISNI